MVLCVSCTCLSKFFLFLFCLHCSVLFDLQVHVVCLCLCICTLYIHIYGRTSFLSSSSISLSDHTQSPSSVLCSFPLDPGTLCTYTHHTYHITYHTSHSHITHAHLHTNTMNIHIKIHVYTFLYTIWKKLKLFTFTQNSLGIDRIIKDVIIFI